MWSTTYVCRVASRHLQAHGTARGLQAALREGAASKTRSFVERYIAVDSKPIVTQLGRTDCGGGTVEGQEGHKGRCARNHVNFENDERKKGKRDLCNGAQRGEGDSELRKTVGKLYCGSQSDFACAVKQYNK